MMMEQYNKNIKVNRAAEHQSYNDKTSRAVTGS